MVIIDGVCPMVFDMPAMQQKYTKRIYLQVKCTNQQNVEKSIPT
jgi:hypothetical protein